MKKDYWQDGQRPQTINVRAIFRILFQTAKLAKLNYGINVQMRLEQKFVKLVLLTGAGSLDAAAVLAEALAREVA